MGGNPYQGEISKSKFYMLIVLGINSLYDLILIGRNLPRGNFICKVKGIIHVGFNFNGKKLRPERNPDQGKIPILRRNSSSGNFICKV